MVAGAWTPYNHLSELIGDATIDLDAASRFRVVLVSSSYTPNAAHTAWSDISANELSTANGYTAGGFGITQTWTRSGSTTTFDSDDPTWSVTGSNLAARYAILMHDADGNGTIASTDAPLAYCLLDTAPADHTVTPGNSFIVVISASGYFSLRLPA